MAEEAAAEGGAKGGMDFLKRKIGPLPAGVWIAGFAVIWWFLQKRQKSGGSAGQQVDPAGNTGSIDPATGYVYGTPADQAALSANNAGTGTSSTTGSGGSTTAGAYPDNNTWAVAAINYLVGIGIDPTAANSAIQQFLASQALTTDQQADVNLAIQRIGAPPSPPQPGTAPSPIVTPPTGGTIYATNPPTGLTVSSKSGSSLGLKWNSTVNATGYTVSWGATSAATEGSTTVTGTTTSHTITGLKPSTLYYVRVQAQPAKGGAGFASVQSSTTAAAATGGTTPPAKTPAPGKAPIEHRVVKDETFSSIAAHYKVPGGGQALYEYQLTTPLHSADAKAKIKQRGPNLLEVGELVVVPQ